MIDKKKYYTLSDIVRNGWINNTSRDTKAQDGVWTSQTSRYALVLSLVHRGKLKAENISLGDRLARYRVLGSEIIKFRENYPAYAPEL